MLEASHCHRAAVKQISNWQHGFLKAKVLQGLLASGMCSPWGRRRMRLHLWPEEAFSECVAALANSLCAICANDCMLAFWQSMWPFFDMLCSTLPPFVVTMLHALFYIAGQLCNNRPICHCSSNLCRFMLLTYSCSLCCRQMLCACTGMPWALPCWQSQPVMWMSPTRVTMASKKSTTWQQMAPTTAWSPT